MYMDHIIDEHWHESHFENEGPETPIINCVDRKIEERPVDCQL